MFSKEAMDSYEELLSKMNPPVKFESFDKTAGVADSMRSFFSKAGPIQINAQGLKKSLGELDTLRDLGLSPKQISNLVKEAPDFLAPYMAKPMSLGDMAMAVGVPAAAGAGGLYAGYQAGKANDEWDKAKAGLAGAAVGLALPSVYKALTQGSGGLNAMAQQLGASGYNPDYADFTSI